MARLRPWVALGGAQSDRLRVSGWVHQPAGPSIGTILAEEGIILEDLGLAVPESVRESLHICREGERLQEAGDGTVRRTGAQAGGREVVAQIADARLG